MKVDQFEGPSSISMGMDSMEIWRRIETSEVDDVDQMSEVDFVYGERVNLELFY